MCKVIPFRCLTNQRAILICLFVCSLMSLMARGQDTPFFFFFFASTATLYLP